MLMLVERGVIDLDEPVCRYWPEFAAAGKEAITVTDLLAHSAGLPAVERPLERADLHQPRQIAAALATQAPMLPPGSPTYHAVTWGWLAGELAPARFGPQPRHDRPRRSWPTRSRPAWASASGRRSARRAGLVRPVPAPGYSLSAFQADDPDPAAHGRCTETRGWRWIPGVTPICSRSKRPR